MAIPAVGPYWEEMLCREVRYDRSTGILYRLGAPIGSIGTSGYLQFRFYGRHFYGHRVIWFLAHGVWPNEIDHIDRNKLNNRESNLREATSRQNKLNIGLRRSNASGITGVSFDSRTGKWRASYTLPNGRYIRTRRFDTKEMAAAARRNAEQQTPDYELSVLQGVNR